jgi:hypothetical protein
MLTLAYNWLRVFRSVEAARLGPDGSQQLQTKVGRSEKCVALRDGCGTSIGVIAACFARVLRGYSGRACMGFLLILQEVRRVCKTRNKFLPNFPVPLSPHFLQLFYGIKFAMLPHPANVSQQQEPFLTGQE